MKIGEFLYFAPGIAFADIDFREKSLPDQYARRIEGFYLAPANALVKERHGFAAGLLIVCAIDALGKVESPDASVGERFKHYCRARLPSFANEAESRQLYELFRNGTVHEARVKDGTEITFESGVCVETAPGGIRVNPQYLLEEVRSALFTQMEEIRNNDDSLKRFKKYLLQQFHTELEGINTRIQQ